MSSLAMLGSCLLSAFLFFSVAFGAAKTNAEEIQYQQLQRDCGKFFLMEIEMLVAQNFSTTHSTFQKFYRISKLQ